MRSRYFSIDMKPITAVTISAFNRPIYFNAFLDSLESQDIDLEQFAFHCYIDGAYNYISKTDYDYNDSRFEVAQLFLDANIPNKALFLSEENLGVALNVNRAITNPLKTYEQIIYLQDDFVLTSNLLDGVLEGLKVIQDNPKYGIISPDPRFYLALFGTTKEKWGMIDQYRQPFLEYIKGVDYIQRDVSELVTKLGVSTEDSSRKVAMKQASLEFYGLNGIIADHIGIIGVHGAK